MFAKAADPAVADKPWLQRRQWASATIRCNTHSQLWLIWIFTLFWNGASSTLWFVIPEELAQGNQAIWIAALFPFIGVLMLGYAVYQTLSWRKFGAVAVTLDPYPGAIGGHLGGSIEVKIPFDPQRQFSLALTCLYSYVSGSGKNRSRKEKILWQCRGFAFSESSSLGTRLHFRFAVPSELPASQRPATSYHLWRLEVSAELPGVDFKRHFELPVFPTGETSRFQHRDSSEHPQMADHREAQIESVLDLRQVEGGIELYFPMLRHAGLKLGFLVFGLIIAGSMWAMSFFLKDAPQLMLIIFGASGLVMTCIPLYGLFNTLKVRMDGQGIHSERHWLGIPIKRTFASRAEITRLRTAVSYSQETGGKQLDICVVLAQLRDGKTITVAESLPGRDVAQQALESIGMLSGYPVDQGL